MKVIVGITTYNLDKYISQTLNSVLAQKTDFDYKIVVADDCSEDETVNILLDYQKKYPSKIEIMLSEKNRGSLANSNRILDKINCTYFSFLDGDDFWIDENKLQKQVDFLDTRTEYSMCAGNTEYVGEIPHNKLLRSNSELDKSYSFHDFINGKMPFFHTSSILFRNSIFINGLPKCYFESIGTFEDCALRGEDFRRILHLEKGSLYAFKDTFSCYRIHSKGIWQGSTNVHRIIESAIATNFYKKYFENLYGNYFKRQAQISYRNMIIHLLVEEDLGNKYKLTKKDSFLLLSYLKDIRIECNEMEKENIWNRIKKKNLKRLYKVLFHDIG